MAKEILLVVDAVSNEKSVHTYKHIFMHTYAFMVNNCSIPRRLVARRFCLAVIYQNWLQLIPIRKVGCILYAWDIFFK